MMHGTMSLKTSFKLYRLFVNILISFNSMDKLYDSKKWPYTNITFSNSDTTFLQKGLKHNLNTKEKLDTKPSPGSRNSHLTATDQWTRGLQRASGRPYKLQRQHNSNTTHKTHPEAKLKKDNPNKTTAEQCHDSTCRQRKFYSHTSHTIRD